MTPLSTETSLISRLHADDADAFVTLYDRYYQFLRFSAEIELGDSEEALDLLQDFFIDFWEKKSYKSIEQIPGKTEDIVLKNYLFTCVRNRCLNFLEKKKNVVLPINEDVLAHPAFVPTSVVESKELGIQLKDAFKKLPAQTAKVCAMVHEGNQKRKEVAEKLSISEHTVKNLLLKGSKILRGELKKVYRSNSTSISSSRY